MTRPVRLQLSRRKGFDLQAWSRQANGLEAVIVCRPYKWGNRYKVGDDNVWRSPPGGSGECRRISVRTAQEAVSFFRSDFEAFLAENSPGRKCTLAALDDLRGKNLACWCHLCPKHAAAGKPLDEHCADCAPCHCDVLGEIICEAVG